MTEFENLKKRCFACVQIALAPNIGYLQAKQINNFLHKLCEMLVDSSNYIQADKIAMKHELELLKEDFSVEITDYYQHR